MSGDLQAQHFGRIRHALEVQHGVPVRGIDVREYPGERNYIVLVDPGDIARAAEVGNALDDELSSDSAKCYVVIRKAPTLAGSTAADVKVEGVQDPRASDLIRLISARSRVSVVQPSLSYVRDAQTNLAAVTAARHQLIFGRRGAGKTALLVEARQQLAGEGAVTSWFNVQTVRHESADRIILYVLDEILSSLQSAQTAVRAESSTSLELVRLVDQVSSLLAAGDPGRRDVLALTPRVQRVLQRFLDLEGISFYIFLDDFYYLARDQQPLVLDVLHGCVRDVDAWLKIASIRHLTRWFQSSPPMGLQTGHDADLIDLDVTLQDPARAQKFLESVLAKYATRVGIGSLSKIFNNNALDRLVIASGAVPRDYLVLASSAIAKAQKRPSAMLVGAQDVNQAAGDAASVKVQELEDDMASNVGTAERTLGALKIVRDFCLEEQGYVYFLVGFRDKETNATEYNLLTDLMDVRLIHMLDSGVSDPHSAGHRLEAFMLDLSQYSGSRLKQRIQVLDFARGTMISRQTRGSGQSRVGDTPLQVISILRAAPAFDLSRLSGLL